MARNLPAARQVEAQAVYAVRVSYMEARLDNLVHIADTADRLTALHEFKTELEAQRKGESPLEALKGMTLNRAKPLSIAGGLGALAVFGTAAGIVAAIAAPVVVPVAVAAARKGYKRYFGAEKADAAMEEKVAAAIADAIATADVAQIALSPQAVSVFSTFPELKERFVIAACAEKARAEKAAPRKEIAHDKTAPAKRKRKS